MNTKAPSIHTSLFDHLPVAAELLEPVYNEKQQIVDFIFKVLNKEAQQFHQQLGQKQVQDEQLLTLYPYLRSNGVFAAFKQVIKSGEPHKEEVQPGKADKWYEATYKFMEGSLLITYQDISSRKTLERQKNSQQALAEKLLQLTDMGIDTATARRDASGKIIDFIYGKPNKKGLSTHQFYETNEVEGKSMLSLYPHIKTSGIFDLLVRTLEKDIPYTDEIYVILNGKDRWFHTNYHRLSPDEILISYLDITERKRTELAAKENEQFVNSIFNATNIGLSALKAVRDEDNQIIDFRYLRSNKKAEDMRPEAMRNTNGKLLLENFPQVAATGIFDILVRVVDKNEPYSGRVTYYHGDKQYWYEVSYGKFGDGVLLSYIDITELQETEERLMASESKFRTLVENIPDVVVRHNLKLEHTYINQAFAEQTGMDPKDFIGKTPYDFNFQEKETEEYVTACKLAIETKKPSTFYGLLKQPNGEHYIFSNIAPEFNKEGEVESLLVITRDITELKSIENNLRLSEQRLEATKNELKAALEEKLQTSAKLNAMINSTSELLCAIDTNYRFIGFNEAFHTEYKKVFGIDLKAGDSLQDTLAHLPEEQMNAMAMWSRVLQGEHYTLLQEYGSRSLERNYYEMTFAPIYQQDKLIGASCLTRNISSERKVEKELKDAQEFLSLAENLPQIVFTKKADGQLDYVNQAFYRYTGIDQIQFPVLKWKQLVHPEDYPAFNDLRNRHIYGADKTDYLLELRLRDKHGNYQWMVFRMIPLFDSNKQLNKWLGTLSNIDLAKNAELKQRQAAEEFKQLSEGLPQLVWMAERDGSVNYYNQKWQEYAGQIPKAGWNWSFLMHPEDLDRTIAAWTEAVENKTLYEIEYRIRRKDGKYRWFLGRSLPIRDLNGKVIKWFGTCTDIHDWKTQQLQLELQNRKLSNLNDYLDTFVHSVAHDLRSPVVNIMGLLDLFASKNNSKESEQLVEMLSNSVRRLDNTLKGMIKLIELQSIETASEEVSIANIFQQVLEEMEKELKATDLKLETNFSDCPSVRFIPSYLESAFRNLISNAIKYKKPDQTLQLKVSCIREKGYTLIHFQDNGIGIDLERYQQKIFKPFKRFTRQAEGKGIGLHLIHSMFTRQGGKITVESQLGQGTTFTLYIPA